MPQLKVELDKPFELVSHNLWSIGALTIHDFRSSALEELATPDVSHNLAYNVTPSLSPSLPSEASGSRAAGSKYIPAPSQKAATDAQNLARLHHTCLRIFGQSHVLKFDFLELGVEQKQCILTITRPEGTVRSYKTKPIFRRKNDAKAQAATIAVEDGALDFITHGDSDELKAKKGVLLAPLDDSHPVASTSSISSNARGSKNFVPEFGKPMLRVKEIETCCKEWRGLVVRPDWFDFDDPKIWNKHGAILRIQLTPHCYRIYSCEPTFDSPSQAREQCAELAIEENVLDFIRHGNGQTSPQSDYTYPYPVLDPQVGSAQSFQRALQAFYEALPRPFEEPFGDKTAAEINAPGLLASLLASAKGARLTSDFYPLTATSDTFPPRIMQGCLLRLNRPGECRSYFAEPQFPSQKDAKAAVSLLALSQGAGNYIRKLGGVVESRVSPEMRRFVLTSVFPALAAETHRISGVAPHFEFSATDDAYGCKLQVSLKPAGDELRQYAVPAEYRSKADAKVAVAYLAAEQGVLDLLRFEGQPIPPGQSPTFTFHNGIPQVIQKPKKKKKKRTADGDMQEGPPAKKQKTAPAARVDVPKPKPKPKHPKPSGSALLPQKPVGIGGFGGQSVGQIYNPYRPGHGAHARPFKWPQNVNNPAVDSRINRSASLEDGEVLSGDE
ncbi:hypothetical protein C8R44DRAFT_853622 [Mycena epipterygia]|nr:hypothetical protein C8R44DRAFT_853622 [Mycena epipterygia]